MQVQGSLLRNYPTLKVNKDGIVQILTKIVKADGPSGLFRGLQPTLATVPTFWGTYFPIYEGVKDVLREIPIISSSGGGEGRDSPLIHVLSAVSAGAVSDCITNPLWVVRTRMQTETLHLMVQAENAGSSGKYLENPMSMTKTIKTLYKNDGIPVFWRGLSASLLGLSHVAIQFPVYEHVKVEIGIYRQGGTEGGKEGPVEWLVASAVSKITACLLTYPHEVIRSRMMDSRSTSRPKSLISTTSHMVAKEGWASLYSGMHVSLIRVIPNCCLTFMSYELFSRWAREVVTNR